MISLSEAWDARRTGIREIRGFDMTQEEFAERIGISQNYFSTMERGKVEIGGGYPASDKLGVCEEC